MTVQNTRLPDTASRGVLAIRVVAASAIVVTAGAVISFVAVGRWDHLPRGAGMFALTAVAFSTLAWLAAPHQPGNRAIWVPALTSLAAGLGTGGWAAGVVVLSLTGLDASVAGWESLSPSEISLAASVGFGLVNLAAVFLLFPMLTFWLLLFPHGELPSARWRWVAWGTGGNLVALAALLLWSAWPTSTINYGTLTIDYQGVLALVDPLYVLLVVFSGICIVSLVLKYRRSAGENRQQYRWVLLGTVALYFAVGIVESVEWRLLAALAGVTVSVACYAVAVTKHRLYDIDLVISRTLVYATLAAFIGGVYVVVVVVVGSLLGSRAGSLGLSVAATALVAVAFEPLRRRVQRWANRLVYGQRATPYEVLSELTRRLSGTEPAQGVLQRMARLMAEGTSAEQATVWLAERGRLIAAAGWPEEPGTTTAETPEQLPGMVFPVSHDDERVGALQVTMPRGNPLTPPQQRLLADLAGSAGLVLGNQRLTAALAARAAELRDSRRRLVELQDAERRRLERDLHDGAQQQVVALKLKIGLAEHMARKQGNTELAEKLTSLAAETQDTVDEIRRLAKGIYPPLLESEDVATAIRSQAAALPIAVEVVSETTGPHPKDVEAALYFAAMEALLNASKHGSPQRITVTLTETKDAVSLQVVNDGPGFAPEESGEGTGLTSVRDRVEALGGRLTVESDRERGTTVSVALPLTVSEASTSPDGETLLGSQT